MDYTLIDNSISDGYNYYLLTGSESMNLTTFSNLGEFVTSAFELAVGVTVLLAVIYLIRTGFVYMLSNGDEEKLEGAQRSMIYTVVGLAIAFVAPLIVRFLLTNVLRVG